MGSPHRVKDVEQLDGTKYAGLNCNCAAAAMALDRETLGKERTTAARVRQLTGDTSGGTTLTQVESALTKGWGVNLHVVRGARFSEFDAGLHAGRGSILQGSSAATIGTKYSASETFRGNHSWWVNEGRGWRLSNGAWVPTDYLVYDPLADGRRDLANAPFWIPRAYVLKFARMLDVNGNGRLLGSGLVWAAWTRDTEPHAHYRYGGKKPTRQPDRTRTQCAPGRRINVRSRPDRIAAGDIVDRLPDGTLFEAYQITTTGISVSGSKVWYGDHDGNRWIHESGLSHKGGST